MITDLIIPPIIKEGTKALVRAVSGSLGQPTKQNQETQPKELGQNDQSVAFYGNVKFNAPVQFNIYNNIKQ